MQNSFIVKLIKNFEYSRKKDIDNKSVADVNAILDLAIDNLLELTSEKISEVEKEIIKILNLWREDFKINNQMEKWNRKLIFFNFLGK